MRGSRGNANVFLLFNQEFITLVSLESILKNIKDGKAMPKAMANHHLYFLPLYLPIFEMGARLK